VYWDLGDGAITNTAAGASLTRVYDAGAWTVSLTASNLAGSSTITRTNAIQVVTPFADWQFRYFACTNCSSALATADPDGDNMSNANEFVAGTDPTDRASVFRIASVARAGNDVCITWSTVTNRSYNVWAAAPASGGSFLNSFGPIPLNPSPIAGTPTNALWRDIGGATNNPSRYYRVSVLPP